MTSNSKKRIGLLLIAVPAGLLLVAVVTRMGLFRSERDLTPAIVANQRYRETIAEWKGKKFYEVQSTAHLKQLLKEVPITGSENLTDDMRSKLLNSIGTMFAAYNDRDSDSYEKFRRVGGVKAQAKSIDWQRKQLLERYSVPDQELPNDADSLHKLYFQRAFASRFTNQCFRLFSPADSVIEVESCTAPPKSFSEFFDKRKNAGLVQYTGTYQAESSADAKASGASPMLIATSAFLIKIDGLNDPCPFACRFQWIEALNAWRPVNLGIAYVGTIPVDLVF